MMSESFEGAVPSSDSLGDEQTQDRRFDAEQKQPDEFQVNTGVFVYGPNTRRNLKPLSSLDTQSIPPLESVKHPPRTFSPTQQTRQKYIAAITNHLNIFDIDMGLFADEEIFYNNGDFEIIPGTPNVALEIKMRALKVILAEDNAENLFNDPHPNFVKIVSDAVNNVVNQIIDDLEKNKNGLNKLTRTVERQPINFTDDQKLFLAQYGIILAQIPSLLPITNVDKLIQVRTLARLFNRFGPGVPNNINYEPFVEEEMKRVMGELVVELVEKHVNSH